MVENSLIEPSDSIVFSPMSRRPFGPIITPEIINPIIEGILTFLNKIGDSRIINNKSEKTRTGFFIGILKAARKCSKKYLISQCFKG
jgi:hypothetical protein